MGLLDEVNFIETRIREIGDSARHSWSEYMKWYTVFLSFNLVGLAYVAGNYISEERYLFRAIAVAVFISFLTIGIFGSILITYRTISAGKNSAAARTKLRDLVKTSYGSETANFALTEPIPIDLAIWTGFANAGGLLGLIVVWALLLWL